MVIVAGYYHIGENATNQLIFPEPIAPTDLAQSDWFKQTFPENCTIAVYNRSFEAGLLQMDINRFVELQPIRYLAKKQLIHIMTLDNSRNFPPWEPENYAPIAYHNYSCLVQETVLWLGRYSYLHPNLRTTYCHQVKQYVENKIYSTF